MPKAIISALWILIAGTFLGLGHAADRFPALEDALAE